MRAGRILASCLAAACSTPPSPALPPPPATSAVPDVGPVEEHPECTAETCAFDRAVEACRLGIFERPSDAEGPRCSCSVDGTTCELTGWKGKVPCGADADCGCTPGYGAAPAKSLSRPKPGDCIVRCSGGFCTATQGML
jgi:hypothetical protein